MSTINIRQVRGNELHHRYPGQNQAQDCYVYLNCKSGALGAEYNGEAGNAVPFAVYQGHVRRYGLPGALREDAANALLEELAPLAQRVFDGYSLRWNGSDNVAHLDADATGADEAIRERCESGAFGDDADRVMVWDASAWLAGIGGRGAQARELGITAETTDAELETIAAAALAEARENDVDELDGLDKHLEHLREYLREIAGAE